MKKRKGITHKKYQKNHLSNQKRKKLSLIIQALAGSDRYTNASPE